VIRIRPYRKNLISTLTWEEKKLLSNKHGNDYFRIKNLQDCIRRNKPKPESYISSAKVSQNNPVLINKNGKDKSFMQGLKKLKS